MATIKELEEYFKNTPRHLQKDKTDYIQYYAFEEPDDMKKYQKEAEESPDWEVIVDDWNEGESFFGAVNCGGKKVLVLDYPNISVYLEYHTEKTFYEQIKALEKVKKEAEERDKEE